MQHAYAAKAEAGYAATGPLNLILLSLVFSHARLVPGRLPILLAEARLIVLLLSWGLWSVKCVHWQTQIATHAPTIWFMVHFSTLCAKQLSWYTCGSALCGSYAALQTMFPTAPGEIQATAESNEFQDTDDTWDREHVPMSTGEQPIASGHVRFVVVLLAAFLCLCLIRPLRTVSSHSRTLICTFSAFLEVGVESSIAAFRAQSQQITPRYASASAPPARQLPDERFSTNCSFRKKRFAEPRSTEGNTRARSVSRPELPGVSFEEPAKYGPESGGRRTTEANTLDTSVNHWSRRRNSRGGSIPVPLVRHVPSVEVHLSSPQDSAKGHGAVGDLSAHMSPKHLSLKAHRAKRCSTSPQQPGIRSQRRCSLESATASSRHQFNALRSYVELGHSNMLKELQKHLHRARATRQVRMLSSSAFSDSSGCA